MTVLVVRLGASEPATVDEIRDDGRTIVADGEVFTLRRLTSHFVLEGEPYYGPRLSFGRAEEEQEPPR